MPKVHMLSHRSEHIHLLLNENWGKIFEKLPTKFMQRAANIARYIRYLTHLSTCVVFFKNNELLLFIGTRIFHRLPLKIHIINRHSNNQIIYTFQKYVQINFWYIFFECHATAGGLYNPEMSSPPQPFPWKICAFSAFTLLY